MRVRSTVLIFLVLVLATLAAAEPLAIHLSGPSNGTIVSEEKVSFSYGFNQQPQVNNCSLMVDDVQIETRGDLISFDNNKITGTLGAGDHLWWIKCITLEGKVVESDGWTLKVDIQLNVSNGYQVVYNNNRFRSYIVPISESYDPVTLPAMPRTMWIY
jgi:hypothetical protein